MQIGQNTFTFLVTDINGTGVTGITSGGFQIGGSVEGTSISGYSYSFSELANGFYNAQVTFEDLGHGYLTVTPATSGKYITPDFWDFDIETNDLDSLYSLFVTLQQQGTVDSVDNFVYSTLNPYKEADDITISYVISTEVTPNLTGWTSMKASLRNTDSPTTSASSQYIGEGTVTVVDALTNTVTIDISGSLTTGVVPEGEYETTLYMDLQGVNASGKKKTLVEFTIPIVRQITYN